MHKSIHQILVSRDLGGAGLIGLHVADHMRRHGAQSHVWVPGEGKAWSKAESLGFSPRRYDAARALGRAKVSAAWANWRLSSELGKAGRGLVHVHAPLFYGALSRGLSRARVRRVVHVHLEEGIEGLRWAFRRPPELIVTCARFLVDVVRRSLPADATTRVAALSNAVDTTRFAPGSKEEARQRVGARLDRPLLVMLANLSAHKGQETAIRTVALLRQRGIEVSLWLAGAERGGGNCYTEELHRLVGEFGVSDLVSFLGQRDDGPDLFRAADCFLLPSTHEGLPLSVLEAQASGTPVLAAPTAGVPEVVEDGKTGFLIAADNVAGYADRVELLLRNRCDRDRIAHTALVKTRRESSWTAYCERIEELYRDLLECRSARGVGHNALRDGKTLKLARDAWISLPS